MCGFGVSNKSDLENSNNFCQRRGPDYTNIQTIEGIHFIHNLLHVTGDVRTQPFTKNNIAVVYNGEIYNYRSFGDYLSDGECLIDLYQQYGYKFVSLLDGEFAICLIDFQNNKIVLATDPFGCKPLWYDFRQKDFCVGSYNSQLSLLGFQGGHKLESNKTVVYDLCDHQLICTLENRKFDIKQFKNTFDDWISAFSTSISKRTKDTSCDIFIGLSSGYDSGAIACELGIQNIPFKAYCITDNENQSILEDRFKKISNVESFTLSPSEFDNWKHELKFNCETFRYDDYRVQDDQSSVGLSAVCYRAKKDKRRIYLSGHGADEIISDYGFNGNKYTRDSRFGGLFPENLAGFWPWYNFYDGTQIKYLNKEEYVAGHFGIEARYPFLDYTLVQEYLWLSSKLKNHRYKSCLDEYLTINNFPFEQNKKRGFNITPKTDEYQWFWQEFWQLEKQFK